jgi:hypothetical protein
LLPRARFYRSTFAIQEALYGVEHGDEAAFERGIAPYLGDEFRVPGSRFQVPPSQP